MASKRQLCELLPRFVMAVHALSLLKVRASFPCEASVAFWGLAASAPAATTEARTRPRIEGAKRGAIRQQKRVIS